MKINIKIKRVEPFKQTRGQTTNISKMNVFVRNMLRINIDLWSEIKIKKYREDRLKSRCVVSVYRHSQFGNKN